MPVDRIQIRTIPRTKDPLTGTEYIVGQDATGNLSGSSFKTDLSTVADYVITQIPDYNPDEKTVLDGTEFVVGQNADDSRIKVEIDTVSQYVTDYIAAISIPIATTLTGTEFFLGQNPDGSAPIKFSIPFVPNITRTVVTITTNTTLLATDSGKAISNSGATANRTWTLPAATVGRLYEIRNDTDAYTLTLQPASNERIGTGAVNKFLRLLNRGSLVLVCRFAGRWEVVNDSAITELQA